MTRHETEDERADRRWEDLLQELRVVQTGTQLIAGFLLTLPFQERFEELSGPQVALYLVLVVLAVLTVALVLTPIAVHRRLAGRYVKPRLVEVASRLARAVLGSAAALLVGIVGFVFWVVLGAVPALVAAGVAALVLLGLLVVLPLRTTGG